MIEEKKKSKVFPTLVLFLGILLIGSGVACQMGYLDPILENLGINQKKNIKKDKVLNNNTSTIEEGKLDVNSEKVLNLYKEINNTNSKDYTYYYYNQDSLEVINMDNKFKNLLALNNSKDNEDGSKDFITVEESYKNIFGDEEFKAETIDINCIEYKYDDINKKFIKDEKGIKCKTDCNTKKEEILSAYQTAEKIEIKTVVAFVNTCNLKYYNDIKFSNQVMDGEEYSNGLLVKNQDKFNHYIYTFTLKDNKYIFTKVEKEV